MIEILAYLHVWLPKPPPPGKTHRNRCCNPDDAEVDAFVEEHRAELEDIVRRTGL